MLGGMISATMILSVFDLKTGESAGSLAVAIVCSLLVAMAACGADQRDDRARCVPAAAKRAAARAADHRDRDVVHPPGHRASRGRARRTSPFPTVLPHGNVFSIGGVSYTWEKLIVVIITVPVLLLLMWLVQYTRQGKAMRATAQDRDAAAMMGIDVNRTISFTFLIAGGARRRRRPALRPLLRPGALRHGLPARADRVHRRRARRHRQPARRRARRALHRLHPGVQRGAALALRRAATGRSRSSSRS